MTGTRIHTGPFVIYDERSVEQLEELFVGAPVWVKVGEDRDVSVRPSAVRALELVPDA